MTDESNNNENDTNQLRPGLWAIVNERYPGSMISKNDFVQLAKLKKSLSESRLTFVSTARVQQKVIDDTITVETETNATEEAKIYEQL
jgi:hypothetical protein